MKTIAAWLLVLGLAGRASARAWQPGDKKDAPPPAKADKKDTPPPDRAEKKDAPPVDKAEEKDEKSSSQDGPPRPRAAYPHEPFPPPAPPVMDPRTHAWEQVRSGDYAPLRCGPEVIVPPAPAPGPVLPSPTLVPGAGAPGVPEQLPPPQGMSSYGRTLNLSWDRQTRAWRLVDVTPQR